MKGRGLHRTKCIVIILIKVLRFYTVPVRLF